jgi:DNA-binding NarL/FixJ family response regulator
MLEALCLVVEQLRQFKLVGVSEDPHQLLKDVAILHPDVVIVDLDLCGLRGVEHLRALRHASRATTIALGSGDDQQASAQRITAFVSQLESPQKLVQLLSQVAAAVR